jgi:predicted metal-dependent peptidase
MEIDKAPERVRKARAALILARRFYGVLVSNVEPVLSRSVPTMATNGKQHFFNPEFVDSLTQEQLEAVQAHETEHDARHHSTRRGGRDPKKWNEACDYAINPDLKAEGFKLPSWVLFDERFRGMSAEDIYRMRELDEQRDQPPSEPEPEENEQGEGEGEGEDAQQPDEQEGDEQGDESGDEPEGGKGAGEPQEGENGGGGGEAPSDDENAPSGAENKPEGGSVGDAAGQNEAQPQSSGDPGRCGEVLDAAEDASEIADIDQKWERITRQAASMAKAIGQLPGHVSRDIERANNPAQDWREVLRAWIDQGSRQIETWNRPNRRLLGSGLFLPGKQRDGLNRVVFVIDTSGSMDAVALACVRTEAQAALDDGAIDEVIAVYGDTRVTRVDTYFDGEEIEFDPRGGGGTDLKPLFKYVEDEVDNASLIICFTDMEIGDPGPEPSCPVLFAATGYPERVRAYLANAPWGAPGIDVGEH